MTSYSRDANQYVLCDVFTDIFVCVDCPSLNNITHGMVETPYGLSTGQNATYTCNHGYDIIGDRIRTCTENGNWSGSEPYCQIKGKLSDISR